MSLCCEQCGEQTPQARKRNFVHIPFSHSPKKIEKNSRHKPLAFLFDFLFRRDQNHRYNLT